MSLEIETVRGDPFEMGRQMGGIFRHVIRADVHQWAARHDFQGEDEYLDECLAPRRLANASVAPWIEEELRGLAEGSGVPLAWLHRLNLRVWYVPRKSQAAETAGAASSAGCCAPQIASACTAIGMLSPQEGVVIGGNLDDSRMPYVLVRRIPKDGLAHVTIARAAGIWNQNGLNEAGLFMAANSLGRFADFKDPDTRPVIPGDTVNRLILQTCADVPQALRLIQESRTNHSYVLGDAHGNLAAVQVMGSLYEVQHAAQHAHMVFCTNHPCMPGLVEPLTAQHCAMEIAEKSRVRFEVLQRARKAEPRSSEALFALLQSHEGYPNSICNNLSVTSMLACPQREKHLCWVADAHPCRNAYVKVPVLN